VSSPKKAKSDASASSATKNREEPIKRLLARNETDAVETRKIGDIIR